MSRDAKATELIAFKQEIISRLDIKSFYWKVVNEQMDFKSDGWLNKHVHCPIHVDTGKANMDINLYTGGFKCFACGKAGSVFDFWCYINGYDPDIGFQSALVALGIEAGIDLPQWLEEIRKKGTLKSSATPSSKVRDAKHYAKNVNKAAVADQSVAPIPPSTIKNFCDALQPQHYKYLNFTRGLTRESIERYKIGFDSKLRYKDRDGQWCNGKYTLPVFCQAGKVRNIRVFAENALPEYKMINTKGYGSPVRIFNLNELVASGWQHVIICEGEWDCILLNQKLRELGIGETWGAICWTAGCNSFEIEFLNYLYDKHVILCFDVDAPGKQWSESHCINYFLTPLSTKLIKSLKNYHLPLDGTKEMKDICDFFMKTSGKIEDIINGINDTKEMHCNEGSTETTVEPISIGNLVDCMRNREYIDQRVCVPITISGNSSKLYHATKSYRVASCPMMQDDKCCNKDGSICTIANGNELFIESSMISRKQLHSELRAMACTLGKECIVEEIEKVVMEQYFGHQVVKRWQSVENEDGRLENSQELVLVPLYILQPEINFSISPQDYMAIGYIRSHPKSRQASIFIESLEPIEQDWKSFVLGAKEKESLRELQELGVEEILNTLTMEVTRIYETDELLLAVLLTYLSPLWLAFNGESIRGWLNICIIGDSGTGKSATYMRVSDWLELGDLFSALSGSRTGFLYSLKTKNDEWYVQVGRYVMANGKIIALDETQMMEKEELGKMVISMDTGKLEISHVASGAYSTQTRMLFMMNPRFDKKISDFQYGCIALKESFSAPFIRRLDLAVFTSYRNDVEFYNKANQKADTGEVVSSRKKLRPDQLKDLIYWAWTRDINQVMWEEGATETCLRKAVDLSLVYGQSDDIPLVNPQDFRNNLARLSASYAALSCSFTEDMESLIIKSEHVEAMAQFVDQCYSSPNCGLKEHSKDSARKKTLTDFDKIVHNFQIIIDYSKNSSQQKWSQGDHFLQMLLLFRQQQYIRKSDLSEQLGVSKEWIKKPVTVLLMHDLIQPHQGGYRTTRKFNLFMQQWQTDPEVEKMLDEVYQKLGRDAMVMDVPLNRDERFSYERRYDEFEAGDAEVKEQKKGKTG